MVVETLTQRDSVHSNRPVDGKDESPTEAKPPAISTAVDGRKTVPIPNSSNSGVKFQSQKSLPSFS